MKPLTGMADRFSELKATFSVKTGAVNVASGEEIATALTNLQAFLFECQKTVAEAQEKAVPGDEGNDVLLNALKGKQTTAEFHVSSAKLAKNRWEAILQRPNEKK